MSSAKKWFPALCKLFSALLTNKIVSAIINQMVNNSSERLDRVFGALSDPTRRAILTRLALGETSVTELAEPFQMSLPAVTKHLKVLEGAGLITRGRYAQWRPCRLDAQPLRDAADWVEQYRKFWDESFDRLDDYLQELQAQEQKNDPAQ